MIFGTKSSPMIIKRGEFNCPNCQKKTNYILRRTKVFFHIWFIPLIPIGRKGDSLECERCYTDYIPGTVIPPNEYLPDNPLGDYEGMAIAPFSKRLGAFGIDYILLMIVTALSTNLGLKLDYYSIPYVASFIS
jgi:hypothetical protein